MVLDSDYDGGFGRDAGRAFRRVIQFVRDAQDERDFYAWKSLHFEKLKGSRKHQRSMRLNDQFRLIIQVDVANDGHVIVVEAIEDYH
jgi:proteic killer suppression protein